MSKDKYAIPDGADWNINININNDINISFDTLRNFYKKYNYDEVF